MTGALFPVVVVHCFFGCGHVVRATDPDAAHEAMERHYRQRHGDDITRTVGTRATPTPKEGITP